MVVYVGPSGKQCIPPLSHHAGRYMRELLVSRYQGEVGVGRPNARGATTTALLQVRRTLGFGT